MFVLHPDPYLLPCFRISPFQTSDLHQNNQFPVSKYVDEYFDHRFGSGHYHYTQDGRHAINVALQSFQLKKDDVVSIFTTTGNFYVSGCVTKEIEKFCRWSREVEVQTKVIFVNHEFGYPYPDLALLKKYGLPIIEDCAHSFFSTDSLQQTGNIGDFVIYSFPKIFPIQVGGVIKTKKAISLSPDKKINEALLRYIKNVLSHHLQNADSLILQRIENHHYLESRLNSAVASVRIPIEKGVVPGVFLFKVKEKEVDLGALKQYLYAHGIQCSVFYGEQSFFIPVHQNLSKFDLDYFAEIISSFHPIFNNK